MDPLFHTFLATGLLAIFYFIGAYRGHRAGVRKGVELTIEYLDEDQYETIIEGIIKEQNERMK